MLLNPVSIDGHHIYHDMDILASIKPAIGVMWRVLIYVTCVARVVRCPEILLRVPAAIASSKPLA